MSHNKKYKKLVLQLSKSDNSLLSDIFRKGKCHVRVFKRVRSLILLNMGWSPPKIAEAVGLTDNSVRNIGWRYINEGINAALYDKSRPGKDRLLSDRQCNQIIAMVCSEAPEGFNRWTIRLIAEESIKRKIVKTVGRERIRILLKSHDLKPWRKKNVVHPR